MGLGSEVRVGGMVVVVAGEYVGFVQVDVWMAERREEERCWLCGR